MEDSFSHVVCPPSDKLQQAAAELYNAIGTALASARDSTERNGQYESHIEAWLLLRLVIRNCEAICVLALKDMVLFPAAMVSARAALELSVRACWLLWPTAVADREARYLCHLRSEESYIERCSEWMPRTAQAGLERSSSIREFREGIGRKLPSGTIVPTEVPKFKDMLAEIGEPAVYAAYSHMSQFAHGTHLATWLNRKNLGTLKQQGEFASDLEWKVVMEVAALALRFGVRAVSRSGAEEGGLPFQY